MEDLKLPFNVPVSKGIKINYEGARKIMAHKTLNTLTYFFYLVNGTQD